MPRDQRTYITVHDGMPDHPKVESLSDPAFRLLVTLWCWCSRNLTDGEIIFVSWSKRGTAKTRQELLDAGLVKITETGVACHDYKQHQRTSDEVRDLREKRADAGRRGGNAKAFAKQTPSKHVALASTVAKQTPSKNVAESETEKDKIKSMRESSRFDEFWEIYPKKVAKQEAEKRWAKLMAKGVDAEAIISGAKVYATSVKNSERKFIKQPDGWLNSGRWTDEVEDGSHQSDIEDVSWMR